MSAATTLKHFWHDVQRGQPGHRFQDRYDRARRTRNRADVVWRVVRIALGIGAIVLGLAEVLFPGPAVVFFFVGGALLASESRVVARAMDWAELRARRLWRWSHRHWQRLSLAARVTLCVASGVAAAGAAIVAYRWWN